MGDNKVVPFLLCFVLETTTISLSLTNLILIFRKWNKPQIIEILKLETKSSILVLASIVNVVADFAFKNSIFKRLNIVTIYSKIKTT